MTAYAIEFRAHAVRALRKVDPTERVAVAKVIDALGGVRGGSYRVIYSVDDNASTVTIAVVGHRREIYRSLDL